MVKKSGKKVTAYRLGNCLKRIFFRWYCLPIPYRGKRGRLVSKSEPRRTLTRRHQTFQRVVDLDVDSGQTSGLVQLAPIVVQLTVGAAHPAHDRAALPHAYAPGHATKGGALLAPPTVVNQARVWNANKKQKNSIILFIETKFLVRRVARYG